jgi:Flp pilus assembly protein TadG
MLIKRPWSEQGASLILTSLALVLLMGMAALAVDLGIAFNERRQDQSAADVGSLAAAQFARPISSAQCAAYSGIQLARCNGAMEAMAVANATLDSPSLADWATASECLGLPAGYTVSPITNCVAFNANLQRAWVKVPNIEVGTVFARVMGFAQVVTNADAIAITGNALSGNLLPFLTPSIVGTSSYDCLKTGPNPNWGVCEDLPATGNFGSGDYFVYGNELIDSITQCFGGTNSRLVYNIANGVDHPLGIHPTGSGTGIHETSSCPIFSAQPDMVTGQSGVGSNLDIGLTQGGTFHSNVPYDGRIEDAGGFLVRNAGGGNPESRVDNNPLWSYLLGGLSGACSAVSSPAQMVACIDQAKSSGTVIFTDSIVDSPRFGFTALMYEPGFLTPGADYHIQSYLPVFLDTTFYGCNASGCTIVHTPGVAETGACLPAPVQVTCGTPGPGNSGLDAITAYILDADILPAAAQTPFPGSANQRTFSLAE